MSSILKALKKLEDEKMSGTTDTLHLESDILRTSKSSPRRFSSGTGLLLLLVFACGITVTYYVMKEPPLPSAAVTTSPVVVTEVRPPVSTVKVETPPKEIVVVPARAAVSNTIVQKKLTKPTQVITVTPKVFRNPGVIIPPSFIEKPKQVDDSASKDPAPVISVPVIRVNGIAFQQSSSDSMAIINGSPVTSGSTVEGATVEEIRKDRVLFQRNGEKFEVQLGQSNQ